jgi:putative ABC transport system permease protein
MSQVFDDERRDAAAAGPAAVASLWTRTLRGMLALAPREHVAIFARDAAFGLRVMRRNPGTTLAAILTMALGIGANTAMFSVVNAVLLGLPFKDQDRVFRLATDSRPGRQPPALTASALRDWQNTPGFEAVAGFWSEGRVVVTGADVERVSVECVSPSLFHVLGVSPAIGHVFADADDRAGAAPVIVLNHRFWSARLGADPSIVGRTITMNDVPVTVLGVMPPEFAGPFVRDRTAGWVPLEPLLARTRASGRVADPMVNIFAKLQEGVSIQAALAPLEPTLRMLAPEDPSARMIAIPIAEQITGDVRPMLVALWGATAFVLLIGAANIAGLLFGRAEARRHEMAVRLALGSARARIVRQLLTESVLLCLIGGGAGVALAAWGLHVIVAMLPGGMPGADRISLDGRVLAVSAIVSLATGLLFGLWPALQASSVAPAFSGGGRAATPTPSRGRARNALVAAEVALSLALLVGAGLVVKTFLHLRPVSPGFDPSGKVVVGVGLPAARYPSEAARLAFYDELAGRLVATDGVAGVSAASVLPLSGFGDFARFAREDAGPSAKPARVFASTVTANFFTEMSIALLQGRMFDDSDRADGQPAVIVNQTLARSLGATGRGALGTRLVVIDDTSGTATRMVVGIVGDTRIMGGVVGPRPQMYLPFAQTTGFPRQFVLRVTRPIGAMTPALRQAIRSIDPRLPAGSITSMSDDVDSTVAGWRFAAILMGGFAVLAILLASVGLLAVVAGSVNNRTREIGVRIALGAQPGDVLRTILSRALISTAIGLGAGVGLAFGTTRFLSDWLVDVSPFDGRTFVFAALAMTLVAAIASYVPARRALEVDPILALRSN